MGEKKWQIIFINLIPAKNLQKKPDKLTSVDLGRKLIN